MIKSEIGHVEIGFPLARILLGDKDIEPEDIPRSLKESEIFADVASILTSIEMIFGRAAMITMLEEYLKTINEKGDKKDE